MLLTFGVTKMNKPANKSIPTIKQQNWSQSLEGLNCTTDLILFWKHNLQIERNVNAGQLSVVPLLRMLTNSSI